MAKMTPEQEADYALSYGSERSSLSKAAQLAYDRLLQERKERAQAEQERKERAQTQPTAGGQHEAAEPRPGRYCTECGAEVTPNAKFCASCGTPTNISARTGQSFSQNDSGQSGMSGDETLQEFDVKYVTFYDGSGHRLGPAECTLTRTRLIISDVRGGIHQILLRDISGITTPSRLAAPKMLRISLPGQAYDIDCKSKDQKVAIEAWLGQAIRGSFR